MVSASRWGVLLNAEMLILVGAGHAVIKRELIRSLYYVCVSRIWILEGLLEVMACYSVQMAWVDRKDAKSKLVELISYVLNMVTMEFIQFHETAPC